MVGHKIKVMEGSTFRMNLSATSPYNADYDGDEMNMHVPQSLSTIAEIKELMMVPNCIVSQQSNKPVIGIIQDTLLGCRKITKRDTFIDRSTFMNIILHLKRVDSSQVFLPKPTILKPTPLWTGKQVFDFLLPNLNFKRKSGWHADDDTSDFSAGDTFVNIVNGQLLTGTLCKKTLGTTEGSLIHRIWLEKGAAYTNWFISNVQYLVNHWLIYEGFTVGAGDLFTKDSVQHRVKECIIEATDRVNAVLNINSNDPTVEARVNQLLNNAMQQAGKVVQDKIPRNNNINLMVTGGSKGSVLNIAQVMANVGQQNVNGKRITSGYTDRALCHFKRGDRSPDACGFVKNSYLTGLEPHEFFFHMMGGREGIIDTAVKTSETGYIQRRLIKAMEDLMVHNDKTVRNSMGHIVSFVYGDDGADGCFLRAQKLIDMQSCVIPSKNTHEMEQIQKCARYLPKTFYSPFHFDVIEDTVRAKRFKDAKITMDDWSAVSSEVDALIRSFITVNTNPEMNTYANMLLEYQTRTQLSTKHLVKNGVTWDGFRWTISKLKEIFQYSRIQHGESIGVIAAQSIGEPTTQLTLNSVTYETEITVRDSNGHLHKTQIGDFITRGISSSKQVDHYNENDTTYATLDEYYEIQAPDEYGNMLWCKIEAVTQHPVINKDGSDTMLKITTENMREVIVTKAKGMLRLQDGKLVPICGDELSLNDYVPISIMPHAHSDVIKFSLTEIFQKDEYLFVSEVVKAVSMYDQHKWWNLHHNREFTLPYLRSDSFRETANAIYINGKKLTQTMNRRNRQYYLKSSCVYMKNNLTSQCHLPECIDLDYNFGYLIGAYCAEGCVTNHQISIANNSHDYMNPIMSWCKQFNITTKYYEKICENGKSSDLRIYSTMLTRIMTILCGKLSQNKRIPNVIIFSNIECKQGFLDGYIGGDGRINIRDGHCIQACSVSLNLLKDLSCLLNTLGIYSIIRKPTRITRNNVGSKNIQQHYNIFVRNLHATKLAKLLNLRIDSKGKLAKAVCVYQRQMNDSPTYNLLPNFDTKTKKIYMSPKEKSFEHIVFEKIVSIQEVPNTTKYAYDLTVEHTRNFTTSFGFTQRDTFHSAGISAKNVTLGVPRFKELINVAKNPKGPGMTVVLDDQVKTQEEAERIACTIEHVFLKDVVDITFAIKDTREDIHASFFGLFPAETEDWKVYDSFIQYKFNAIKLTQHKLSPLDVCVALMKTYTTDSIMAVSCPVNLTLDVFVVDVDQDASKFDLRRLGSKILHRTVISGVSGISRCFVKQEDSDRWIIETDGNNMMSIVSHPFVDPTRTISNEPLEIAATLGIEAAREVLLKEIRKVIEFDGSYVNVRHFNTLVDTMTYKGDIMSITRHGINRSATGPLMRCSFEETVDVLNEAAIFSEKDEIRGVTESITLGKLASIGTGNLQIKFNESLVKDTVEPRLEI